MVVAWFDGDLVVFSCGLGRTGWYGVEGWDDMMEEWKEWAGEKTVSVHDTTTTTTTTTRHHHSTTGHSLTSTLDLVVQLPDHGEPKEHASGER